MHVCNNINANEYMEYRRETKDIIHSGGKENTVRDRDMYAHTLILAQEQNKLHFDPSDTTCTIKMLHANTYQHTHIYPHINTYRHTLTYKYIDTNKLTHKHTHKEKHKHRQANKKTSKHIHTYIHTNQNAQRHTNSYVKLQTQ